MGFKLSEAYVEIKADDRKITAALRSVKSQVTSTVSDVRSALNSLGSAGGLGAGFGIAAVGYGIADATRKAADFNEALSKAQTTFGPGFKTINRTVDDMASRFGLVKTTTYEMAANLGLITQAAGMSRQASAELSAQLTKLAADASSFFNVRMDEALQRIQSGLSGEAEPMRRFGVLLNEDAVKAEALKMGLVGATGKIDDQAKVAARASLIIKGMATVTGDLERTQDSAANQMRKFTGEIENFKTDFGQNFIGPMTDGIKLAREFASTLGAATDMGTGAKAGEGLGGFFSGLFGGLRGVNAAGLKAAERMQGNAPAGSRRALEGPLGLFATTGIERAFAGPLNYLVGGMKQAFFPSQELADKLAGVAKGGPAAPKALTPLQQEIERNIAAFFALRQAVWDVQKLERDQASRGFMAGLKGIGGAAAGQARAAAGMFGNERLAQMQGQMAFAGAGGAGTLLAGLARAVQGARQNMGEQQPFQSRFYEGGRDLARSITAAGFEQRGKEQQKIAENTGKLVEEFKTLGKDIRDAAKSKFPALFGG